MKHCKSRRANQIGRLAKTMMIGSAAVAFLGFSLNAQADLPECTVANWDDNGAVVGLSDADTGYQGSNNRRYGGPCGLRIAFDGEDRYLINDTPSNEQSYIARFYAFLNDLGDSSAIIFAGEGGGDDHFQVWFNEPAAGDLTLRIFDASGTPVDLVYNDLDSGWHSIEVVWESGSDAEIRFALNSDDPQNDLVTTVDNSGLGIDSAWLGNVAGADIGGTADFDDFDSRRDTRPQRLCRGDTTGSESIGFADLNNIGGEVISGGAQLAFGQPDYTESGAIGFNDLNAVFANHVSISNPDCP